MSDQPSGAPVPKVAHVHEVVIRWVPETGNIQFGSSVADPVIQLGLLEMAKMALIEQKIQTLMGKGPSLIVPGRFAS
jgi:hypothetical protein